jgi:glycosyltransferase involved in cell wall biosynthesis
VARSLSVLLPVKNAQNTLSSTVQKILDAVSELSEKMELLIIDDGSADATSEIAVELTRHYPQVKAICQGRSLGKDVAIRSGLKKATGKVALIYEENQGMPLVELAQALKSDPPAGQFYFRLDTANTPKEIKPVDRSRYLADHKISELRHEHQSQISSRPARPNFMDRLKDIVLGE